MKTIKPPKLAICHRPFYEDGRYRLVLSVMALFPLDAPVVLLPEVNLWKLVAKELAERPVLDDWLPKARGEYLVTGRACPPGGEAPRCAVRVGVGALEKTLAVFGDRFWGATAPTRPVPFREMPITYARAFGGEGYAANPLGRGVREIKTEHGALQPLPNVEDPRALVASPGDRPRPASFGAIDVMWPERARKAGTVGDKWLKERYPGYPEDMDPTYFNVAPDDQQLREGFFRGDEALRVENMHASKGVIESELPRILARAFVRRTGSDALEEVPLVLETVHLFPSAERGVVLYRGKVDVCDDAATDLSHLLVAADALGAPRPLAHYQRALDERLDERKGGVAQLRSKDLLPDRPTPKHPGDVFSDIDDLVRGKQLMRANQRRGTTRDLAATRARVEAHEKDPKDYGLFENLPEDEPVPEDGDDVAEYFERMDARAETLRADADARREEALREKRERAKEFGKDYDQMVADGLKEAAGPPKFRADDKLATMREQATLGKNAGIDVGFLDAMIESPEFVAMLRDAERQQREAYRRYAQFYPEPGRMPPQEAARVRELVVEDHRAGASFLDRDLTGADLSKLDLSGGNFAGCFLERADLRGANLAGAELTSAVLARADLRGANLSGARLTDANLGGADLTGANLSDALLHSATLMRAKLAGAQFRGADLDRANLLEAELRDGNFAGVRAPQLILYQLALGALSFRDAELREGVFAECDLTGADFSGSDLSKTSFVGCKLDGASFRGALLAGASFPKGTSLVRADFRRARMPRCNVRGAGLQGADFTEAIAEMADFSDADLREATLTRMVAPGALFLRSDLRKAQVVAANLREALFQWANIRETTFKGSNLFRADFAFIVGDRGTSFDDALMDQIRFVERRDAEPPR